MRIFVYGIKSDYDTCVSLLSDVPELQYRHLNYSHTDSYDDFIKLLADQKNELDLIVIVSDGASGMEAVMAAKSVSSSVPVVWISDDAGFGTQSYRLGCSFFGVKPMSGEMMVNAIRKYSQERVG